MGSVPKAGSLTHVGRELISEIRRHFDMRLDERNHPIGTQELPGFCVDPDESFTFIAKMAIAPVYTTSARATGWEGTLDRDKLVQALG